MDVKATDSKAVKVAKRLFSIGRARFNESDSSNTSILVSYYLLLALFPLVILLGNLLPYLDISAPMILDYLQITFPEPVWNLIEPTIEGLLRAPNPALFFASFIAFGGAAIKAVQQLYGGLVKAYGIRERPGFWANQIIAVIAIVLILASLLVFVLIFVFGEMLLDALWAAAPWTTTASMTLWAVRGSVAAVFLFVLFCILYRLLPYGGLKLSEVWPGAAFTTIALVILSDAFALYVHFAANSLAIYGAISIFFVLMVWLNFSTTLIMAGTLINATLRQYRKTYPPNRAPQEKGKDDTPQAPGEEDEKS